MESDELRALTREIVREVGVRCKDFYPTSRREKDQWLGGPVELVLLDCVRKHSKGKESG